MRLTILLVTALAASTIGFSQEYRYYLGASYGQQVYQDLRQSNLIWSAGNLMPEVGFEYRDNQRLAFFNASIYGVEYVHPYDPSITQTGSGHQFRLGYVHAVTPTIKLGGTWDIMDYDRRRNESLINGADAYWLSSDLYFSAYYEKQLSDYWRVKAGIDYGVLTAVNAMPSFGGNYQQNVIDNGELTFIDGDTRNPYLIQNMEVKGFWNLFQVRPSAEIYLGRWWSFAYQWDLSTYADVSDYNYTRARHIFSVRFHYTQRPNR